MMRIPSALSLKSARVAALFAVAVASAAPAADPTFESDLPATPDTRIDQMVFAGLAKLNLRPVLCSDAVFVRRAYLDVLGIVPTADEARKFIEDPDAKNKRRLLIDRLLERPEFADYWAMRWSDILRIKAEFPVNLWPNAAQAYHRWIRASLAENKPYDRFVRELLTSSGSNFRVPPVNFYRAIQNRTPDGIAGAVALTFMGTRTDVWPTNQLAGMAAFFSQVGYKPTSEWKEENVFWDPLGASAIAANVAPGRDAIVRTNAPPVAMLPTNRPPQTAMFPDGKTIRLPPDRDPREVFADWLVSPKNPWFPRAIVNRVWYWLLGRGIVHEPDDIRPGNPPSNPALLTYLSDELVAHQFDLKHIYRLILNSKTYQLSSMPRTGVAGAEAAFASYPLRRLDAEVLIDAINSISGTTDLYTSPIPEPFTYIPEDVTAIRIADGSITSPFLTLFGRTARATGMESERDNRPLPAQWRHLLNSSHIQRKIEDGPSLKAIYRSDRAPGKILEELYLTIVSRFPTPAEVKAAEAYGGFATAAAPAANAAAPAGGTGKYGGKGAYKGSSKGYDKTAAKAAAKADYTSRQASFLKQREGWVDIAWALINSSEFLYRH